MYLYKSFTKKWNEIVGSSKIRVTRFLLFSAGQDFSSPHLKWLTQANYHQMLWNNSSLKKPNPKQNKPTTHIYHFKENLQNQKYVQIDGLRPARTLLQVYRASPNSTNRKTRLQIYQGYNLIANTCYHIFLGAITCNIYQAIKLGWASNHNFISELLFAGVFKTVTWIADIVL